MLPDVQVRPLRHRTSVVRVTPVFELGLHITQFPACLLRVWVVLPDHGLLDLDAALPPPDAALVGSLALPQFVVVGIIGVGGRLGEAGQEQRAAV